MIFSLDVRRARKGDCLLLHFGTVAEPGLVIIDGGPSSVFKPHLKPRIDAIRAARGLSAAESLPVDLMMVSHVDDDHIRGLLDLTKAEVEALDAQRPLLLNVQDLWHNSFDEIIDNSPAELTASLVQQFGAAAASGSAALPDAALREVELKAKLGSSAVRDGLAVLASVLQGFRLQRDADRLGIPINDAFDGKLVLAKKTKVKVGDSLKMTVAGPMRAEVIELQKEHDKWLKALKKAGKTPAEALAAYLDKSPANLSSLVILAAVQGKRILLTGDARGDKILEGLEKVGLLKPGKTMRVDVLKVPHHGSANNLDDDFFERIIADHYVFSGNGEHGNPERESVEMLFEARGSDPFTVHLTYPVADIDVARKADWEKEQKREKAKKAKKPSTRVRPNWSAKKHALASFFADGLSPGQEVRIVPATKPHVIDLLDPLNL